MVFSHLFFKLISYPRFRLEYIKCISAEDALHFRGSPLKNHVFPQIKADIDIKAPKRFKITVYLIVNITDLSLII
ncbi:hypothetical protein B9T29_11460 [Acinetobacter sp. ANC 3903]|nr:hypothetical protein B9T29_11460 [Acinetobacter sp. ANC 3903]